MQANRCESVAPDARFALLFAPIGSETAQICRFPVGHPIGKDLNTLLTAKVLIEPAIFADLALLKACLPG